MSREIKFRFFDGEKMCPVGELTFFEGGGYNINEEFPSTEVFGTELKYPMGTGGLRKIKDIKPPCLHPGHNPPNQYNYEPGAYEYTCPGCGQRIEFYVPGTFM